MIITLASSKGGVGKSTTCAALAGAYAKSGERVHIVDLDSNGTVSRWLADAAVRPKNLTVSKPDPAILTEHLQEAARHFAPDIILVDVAGSYERALTIAIARAHLTIIPTCTTGRRSCGSVRLDSCSPAQECSAVPAAGVTTPTARRRLYPQSATRSRSGPRFRASS